jgi:CRP/FNR family transcriptional regulator, cyclic AMP receptor protein
MAGTEPLPGGRAFPMLRAMPASSYLDHLAQVPLFSACSKKDLRAIAKAADEITVDGDRTVVEQGAAGKEAFIIIEGRAGVRRNGRRIAGLGPGDYFGELALLDGGPRTADVIAESTLRLLVLGQREFTWLLDEVPGLSLKVLRSMAERIRELDQRIYP